MTEIIITADKKIYISENERNYRGESKPDVFRILVPYRFNGICSENARITFHYISSSGKSSVVPLNDVEGRVSRLGSYFVFEFRMAKDFYENTGKVRCWVEFENKTRGIRIKSECGDVIINRHY